jgi:cytochrome P450
MPTAFWFTNIAFSDPKFTKLIRERVALYLKDPNSKAISSSVFDIDRLINDPVLTSFFSEVLRLKASVWSFRLCLEDVVLPVGGKEYFLPQGSAVWVPVALIHRDEDVYSDPLNFEPSRFLKVDKSVDEDGKVHEKVIKKVLFTKNGKQTRLSHLPFGGGKSMVWIPNTRINDSVPEETLRDRS